MGGNTNVDSIYGPVDFDWFVDLAMFPTTVDLAYPFGKTLWNIDMKKWNIYSLEEVNAIKAVRFNIPPFETPLDKIFKPALEQCKAYENKCGE